MIYLFALGIALAIWEIVVGMQNRKVQILGQVYAKASRDVQPVRYWLFLAINFVWLLGFIVLFFHELKQ